MFETRQNLLGGALSLGLGLCLLLWLIPAWVEPDADLRLPVSLLPQIVAIGFVLCGVAMIASAVLQRNQNAKPARVGFEPGEFQGLLVMLALLLGATIGFAYLHFLIVAPALVAASMWIYSPIKPISFVLTSALGPLVIWVLATQVLGRVLP
ncbi:MAG: hypothetical protein AB3N11_12965 [Arenibacterium sp.]